jgi:hypothetical protein
MSDFAIIDPDQAVRRPVLAEAVRSCGLFGSPAWLSVMQQAYGYRPLYLVGTNGGDLPVLLVPFMEVRSALTGCRGISIPFSDYCGMPASGDEKFHEGIRFLIEYGRKRRWRYLELRPEQSEGELDLEQIYARYYVHTLDLQPEKDELFPSFSKNTRRNIQKAGKRGLAVRSGTSWSDVLDFYDLHTLTRRHHGLPPQPLGFFQKLHQEILANGGGTVVLASDKGVPVAGSLYLWKGERAWYKYGALDRKHAATRAPFLVMWKAILLLKAAGVKTLCLGRSDPLSEGLVRFKDGWGAARKFVAYVRYDYAGKGFACSRQCGPSPATCLFRRMPLGLLRFAGRALYRHEA